MRFDRDYVYVCACACACACVCVCAVCELVSRMTRHDMTSEKNLSLISRSVLCVLRRMIL